MRAALTKQNKQYPNGLAIHNNGNKTPAKLDDEQMLMDFRFVFILANHF